MLILTVRPLAFQGYTILHITYLKNFQKLEFFEKNRKKSRNSRFLLRTIFSMLSAKSFTSQGHLIAKKKICGRGNIITSAAFFSFWEKMIAFTQSCCGFMIYNKIHGENLIAAKLNPDLTPCHMDNCYSIPLPCPLLPVNTECHVLQKSSRNRRPTMTCFLIHSLGILVRFLISWTSVDGNIDINP